MKTAPCVPLLFLLLAMHLTTDADQEGPYTYTTANGQATITDFDASYSGALDITNTLGGYPVTTIANSAFRDCTAVSTVTIPSGVTTIAARAFCPVQLHRAIRGR